MSVTVALRSIPDYDRASVETATAELLEACHFPDVTGMTVLLKPNLLFAREAERAVTTHPVVVAAAAKAIFGRGASRVLVGDSPGYQSGRVVAKKAGILDAIEDVGAEWADFDDQVRVESPDARLVRSFPIARAVREADMVISLPKLKTHTLLRYTGAVKNLFGTVPGLEKGKYHLRFPDTRDFSSMLADLLLTIGPSFAIMDGIVAMEGPGPGSGNPRRFGLLAASANPVALDFACAEAMGYDPAAIDHLREASLRGAYGFSPSDVRIDGPAPDSFRLPDFDLVKSGRDFPISPGRMPGFLYRLAESALLAYPRFSARACVGCGGCVSICPAKALSPGESGRSKAPRLSRSACIRCYCCQEICPADAVSVRGIAKPRKQGARHGTCR